MTFIVIWHDHFVVRLAADAEQEMFSAIWTAFSESTAADGSINLTISGAKTVPDYGFFDNDNYFENGEKNIAGDKLKSLTLPDVETIGDFAFSACTYLESVNLPQVVTIGECAFSGCSALTSVAIGSSVTSIGNYVFSRCSSLTNITFLGTKEQWNAIEKGSSWNDGNYIYTVHCIDGDIVLC